MKKLASILLIILYATTSSGASFHFHFCMGQFRGIGLAAGSDKACDQCGMKKGSNRCCSDIVKTFKTSSDQSASTVGFDFTQYAHTLPVAGGYSTRAPLFTSASVFLFTTGPPKPPLLPLFIRDRNFRI